MPQARRFSAFGILPADAFGAFTVVEAPMSWPTPLNRMLCVASGSQIRMSPPIAERTVT